jgi:hypothetical protein
VKKKKKGERKADWEEFEHTLESVGNKQIRELELLSEILNTYPSSLLHFQEEAIRVFRGMKGSWRVENGYQALKDQIEEVSREREVEIRGSTPALAEEVAMLKAARADKIRYLAALKYAFAEGIGEGEDTDVWQGAKAEIERMEVELDALVQAHQNREAVEPPPPAKNIFRWEDDSWKITYEGQTLPGFQHLDGFFYIAYLLADNKAIHCSILRSTLVTWKKNPQLDPRHQAYNKRTQEQLAEDGLSLSGPDDLGDLGSLIDSTAIEECERWLEMINEQLASDQTDSGEKVDLQRTRDLLQRRLNADRSLGGRPRKVGSQAEKDRGPVTKAIKFAIARIKKKHKALGAHFERSISTGTTCMYNPVNPTTWSL